MGRVKEIDCPYLGKNGRGEFICRGTRELDPCNFPNCDWAQKQNESLNTTLETKLDQSNIAKTQKLERGIITLCGSTKFKDEFIAMLEILTLGGWIVLLPGYYGHCARFPVSEEVKDTLDALHKKKIDMSDAIYVLNIDGYIGESTKDEIQYAKEHNKEIIYYE